MRAFPIPRRALAARNTLAPCPPAALAQSPLPPFLCALRCQSTTSSSDKPSNSTTQPTAEPTEASSPKLTDSWPLPRSRLLNPSASSSTSSIGGRSEETLLQRLNLPRGISGSSPMSPLGSIITASAARSTEYFNAAEFLARTGPEQERRRLVPSLGREVPVTNGVDPARAFTLLNMSVRNNRVARDVRLQRFHERPGLKRKRLKSERWRARFRQSFIATVSRVRELAKQGW